MKHLIVYFLLCWMVLSTPVGSRADDEEDEEQDDRSQTDDQTSTVQPRQELPLTCYQCDADEGSDLDKTCGVDASTSKVCDPAGDCSVETIEGTPKKFKRACTPDCKETATLKCCKENLCNKKNSASFLSSSLIDSGVMQLAATMLAIMPFVLKI